MESQVETEMPCKPNGHRPDIVVCTCLLVCQRLCLCLWQKLNAPATKEASGGGFLWQNEPPPDGSAFRGPGIWDHNKAHYMSAFSVLQVPKVKCSSRTDLVVRETIASSCSLISYAEQAVKTNTVDFR